MKKPIKILILFLLLLSLLPATVLIAEAKLPKLYAESYYAELPLMYQRLQKAEGKKIVVVGGSNVAFGLDSGLMEQLLADKGLDYTVCSFGLYAAVGTSAMLDLSLNTLHEGDIVVLALEPTTETMSTYFGATAYWKCTEGASSLLFGVDGSKREALVGNYIPYLQERYEIVNSGIYPKVEGVYAKSSFNDRCDLIFDRPGNIMSLGFDTDAPVDLAAVTIAPDFAQQVNDYCAKAQSVGAQVYLSFSPVNRTALTSDDEGVKVFFDLCNDTFACPVISNPEDYILDSGWFYDSNFHLNTPGAKVRTALLTEDLLAALGCFEKPSLELPQMPGSAAPGVEEAGDADCFTFEPVKNGDGQILGYRIAGLQPTAKDAKELTAPGIYEGRPVVGFAKDALKEAKSLVRLRLPQSIESLPDGLFASCPSLAQLILEHTEKPCSVSEHTFDGADHLIVLVPRDSFSLYRDGFGCETNPWVQYLDRIYTF